MGFNRTSQWSVLMTFMGVVLCVPPSFALLNEWQWWLWPSQYTFGSSTVF